MPRPTTEHYDLSESEKRDLIALIEKGKPLPEKYHFLLFADKLGRTRLERQDPRCLHRHPPLPNPRTH